jgi:hypothetical protein
LSAGTRPPEGSEYVPPVPTLPKPTRTQARLGVGVLLFYAIGYPVALVANSPVGWVLVTIGGVFLLLLGIVTVRRMHSAPPS